MAEARAAPLDSKYRASRIAAEDRRLVIAWADGHVSRFPLIWLRHDRFFPVQGRPEQGDDDPPLVPEDPEILAIGHLQEGPQGIEIRWAHDGSVTRYDLVWLRDNCISPEAQQARRPKPVFWNGAEAAKLLWRDASDLEDPHKRLEIFLELRDRGISLLRGLAPEPGALREIAPYFGPLRRTHHGSLFNIRSLPIDRQGARVGIGATANNAQAAHNDEVFRHHPLGIMLFHCLKPDPSGGGASFFVDAVAAAEALRENDPEAFDLLARTPLLFAAERNPKERYRTRGRMIATDVDGTVRGVRISDRTFPPLDLPEDQIEPAYRAIKAFHEELFAPARIFERLLQPGDLVLFDNHRVLHARRAFDQQAGERCIQQVSIDRDEFHSLFRQLAEEVGRPDLSLWEPDAGALSQG